MARSGARPALLSQDSTSLYAFCSRITLVCSEVEDTYILPSSTYMMMFMGVGWEGVKSLSGAAIGGGGVNFSSSSAE